MVKRQAFLEFGLSLSCGQMLLKIPVLRIMQESSLSAAFHLPTSVFLPGAAQLPNVATSLHLGFETSPLGQTSFQCKYLLLCYALKYFFYVSTTRFIVSHF